MKVKLESSSIGIGEVNKNNIELLPRQQIETAKKLQVCANSFFQKFIKFPYIAIFHSYAELLHAALLESDSRVSSFVPQPLRLLIQNRRYIPDCFYVHKSKRYVVEIKPVGKFEEKFEIPLKAFMSSHGMKFKVVTNESIMEQERLALNWLHIIRTLINAELIQTDEEEMLLVERLSIEGVLEIGDVISIGNRLMDCKNEISLFRLAHMGKVKLHFDDKNIQFSTGVSLCI